MLVIINGYVALSNLHTQFYYIVAVDIGASIGWGLIDGFAYAMSEAIVRANQVAIAEKIQSDAKDTSIDKIVDELGDTFLSQISYEGRRNIAAEILRNSSNVSIKEPKILTREDLAGLVSILGIYLSAGIALSISYVILPNKFNAWLVSNVIGIGWLFYYGYTIGKIGGQRRILLGLLTSLAGIAFLVLSYILYA